MCDGADRSRLGGWRDEGCMADYCIAVGGLFVHFLTDSTNRSTSCLSSTMLSSAQEITCHYIPHQSFSPLICLPSHVWISLGPFHTLLFISPRTAYYNDPSISCREVLFPPFVEVISPPTLHSVPTSFDPVAAHLNAAKIWHFKAESRGVAASHCCASDVQKCFFFGVWNDLIVTPVKLISRGICHFHKLPSAASFNELFKPAVNQHFLMRVTSALRAGTFPFALLIFSTITGVNGEKWRRSSKFNRGHLRAHLQALTLTVCSISIRSRSAEVSLWHFDVRVGSW